MYEYIAISVSTFIFGDIRTRKTAQALLLSWTVAFVTWNIIQPVSFEDILYTAHLILPLIFTMFFISCYRHHKTRGKRFCITLCVLSYYLVGVFNIIYVPYFTEICLRWGEAIKIEAINNLCLTLTLANTLKYKRNENLEGFIKIFVFMYAWLLIKIWTWAY